MLLVRPVLRLNRWSRQLHRWLAYGLGAIVALWVISGVVMLFPASVTRRPQVHESIDPGLATQSPSQALEALPADARVNVERLVLRELGGRLVYHFSLASGLHHFVDASTAQRVALTDSVAASHARRYMGDSATRVASISVVRDHDRAYRFGALPAYRIVIGDTRTIVHVGSDGTITTSDPRSRWHATIAGLHTFQIAGLPSPSFRARKIMLLGASVFTVALIVTGYVLLWPRRLIRTEDIER